MAANTYTTFKSLDGFDIESIQQLNSHLEAAGLKYQQPELGGGEFETVTQVIAWLDLHPTYAGILVFTVSRVFKVVRRWYKKNPPAQERTRSNKAIKNVVNFSIRAKTKSIGFELDVSRDYSYREITQVIRKAKGAKK